MKLLRYLSLIASLIVAPHAWSQSQALTPVNVNLAGTYVATAGNFYVITPACSGVVTFNLATQQAGTLSVVIKNQCQQQAKVTGTIYANGPVSYVYVNPGQMATFSTDGVYENVYLPQQLIDTYTQSLNGTAYTLTTTLAAVTGSTQNPVIQINNWDAGWYVLQASGTVYEAGFTIANPQNVQIQIYRTNNTTGAIPGSGTTVFLGTVTTVTASYAFFCPPVLVYLNGLDILTIYASVGNTGTAGSVTIPQASLLAFRYQ